MTEETTEQVDVLDEYVAEAETKEESVPQEVETPETETSEPIAEEPKQDGFQKRINKVTADKWEQQRRAEAAEARLAELQANQASTPSTSTEPTLEDFDYDDNAYQSALIEHKVKQATDGIVKAQDDKRSQDSQAAVAKRFDENAVKFSVDKEDFQEVLAKVPTLQPQVLNAVMQSDNGPEIAYYLGNHLDAADSIATMDSMSAAMEIGKISAKLATPKQIKPSSAPEPIEALSSGAVVETDIGDDMPIDAWMKKYNP